MLQIKNINHSYGNKKILNNINLDINKGECIGIVGYNGCGKSTLLSILSGIQKPNSGEITLDNNIIVNNKKINNKIMRTKIGYVPQENPLIEELSVYDNLTLWFNSRQELKDNLENGILKKLKIDTFINKKINQLSGGMKKRISIAIATITNPDILILDEPGAALDIACKEDIKEYLLDYKSQNKNIIIVTHEDNELDLCDRIFVLKDASLQEIDKNLRGKNIVEKF